VGGEIPLQQKRVRLTEERGLHPAEVPALALLPPCLQGAGLARESRGSNVAAHFVGQESLKKIYTDLSNVRND